MPKVVVCCPTLDQPHAQFTASLEAELPLLDAAGFECETIYERGNTYISFARALMLRKALDAKAEIIVFIDHDLSWKAGDLTKLVKTEGHVIAGTYRYKNGRPDATYMGEVDLTAPWREDGCIRALCAPAGFLKITRVAIHEFISHYPHLTFGDRCNPHIDLFNHGAEDGVWWGEDYAFSRHWNKCGGELWIRPDLNIDHWRDGECFPGNLLDHLNRTEG